MTLLEWALTYARRGWPVFPCNPRTKRPLCKGDVDPETGKEIPGSGGVKKATTDEEQIRAWWKKWPKAMIGLATGAAAGVFVVDFDAGEDEETGEVFEAPQLVANLEERIGVKLPKTWAAETPRGGQHLYFAWPAGEDVIGNRGGMIDRVDVRGEGGYVILPPSARTDGKGYTWTVKVSGRFAQAAEAPGELVDCILRRGRFGDSGGSSAAAKKARPGIAERAQAAVRRPAGVDEASVDAVDQAVDAYARKAFEAEIDNVANAPKGQGNNTLNIAALKLGELVAAGVLSESEVRQGLENAAMNSGLVARDGMRSVLATIDSGFSKGMRQPRDLEAIRAAAADRARRRRANGPPRAAAARHQAGGAAQAPLDASEQPPPPQPGVGHNGGPAIGPAPHPPEGVEGEPTLAAESFEPSEKMLREACELDHSDTDNGKRLRIYFGSDLLVMAEGGVQGGGFLTWTATHWDVEGGAAGAVMKAQLVGACISREADHMVELPHEKRAIENGLAAATELAALPPEDDWTDEQRARAKELAAAIAAMQGARAAFGGRKGSRRKFGVSSKNRARIENMLASAAPHLRRPSDAFNGDPLKVATRNVTLKFKRVQDLECPDPDTRRYTAEVEPVPGHRREDLITALIPVDYDPEATAPKWLANMERFQPDEATRRTVQAYAGLGLLGLPVQRLMYHYGVGGNFKSVFLEVLARVLGDSFATTLPAESITGFGERSAGQASPDLARLFGKRFLRVPELKPDVPLQVELIKRLTGGERISVRTLFKGYFDFTPAAKAHLSGNGLPTFDGSDGGMRRRLLLVKWPVTLAESEQRDFDEVVGELMEEASGILNWLIAGAKDYLANGLVVADAVRATTQEYLDDMDPAGQFVRAHVEDAPGEKVAARAMYHAYEAWSSANAKKPITETRFGRVMKKKLNFDDTGRVRLYLDVRLHDVPENDRAPPPNGPDAYGDDPISV